ncbi:hypothetical protein MAE02_50970 [Microvirga aerophila]|uniref:Uncharacterized protein n=1 Tax=Microvirga aerophila TaxID=670291 RepID=A0A512BZM2_9HYPH|nr:hypothetical protein MAE02_50970 [Microvirga aerophila]
MRWTAQAETYGRPSTKIGTTFMNNDDAWLELVEAGDFSVIAVSLRWSQSLLFSQAIGNM